MMDWIAQALLDSAGFIVSCFIARETPQFAVMQGSLALVLLVCPCGRGGVLACALDHSVQQLHNKG